MLRRSFPLLIVSLVGAALLGSACLQAGSGPLIDMDGAPAGASATSSAPAVPGALTLAVALVNSPRRTLAAYTELATYLGDRLGMDARVITNRTYAEINNLVRFQEATLAFVCTAPYVYGQAEFGMTILAAPVVNGETVYYSYLIVRAGSSITTWDGLRGATFAFTDPLSNSGRLVPVYHLATLGESPDTFFGRTTFTYSHDNAIRAVANGLVDGAAVDSLLYDYLLARRDPDVQKTRVIWRSDPQPISPIVVNPNLDPALQVRLRDLLLSMDETSEGRSILAALGFDGFTTMADAAYDPVRAMIDAVEGVAR